MAKRNTHIVGASVLRVIGGGPGGGYESFVVGIPTKYGRAARAAGVVAFTVEATDDGLLLRPVKAETDVPAPELPEWMRNG